MKRHQIWLTTIGMFSVIRSSPAWAQKLPSRMLANTPPMGWNSWNLFEQRINEQLIHEIADAIVRSGMKDAGYLTVCIDDSWVIPSQGSVTGRDEKGILIADPAKFPSGMKAVGE